LLKPTGKGGNFVKENVPNLPEHLTQDKGDQCHIKRHKWLLDLQSDYRRADLGVTY